jgi:membrane protein insertase Oxa1/YidC/SpoIIIJ
LWLVSRPCAKEFIQSFVGINSSLYSPVVTVFAFTAAFLGASVWGAFNTNANSVNAERQAIYIYVDTINATPTLSHQGLQSLLKVYLRSAIEDEWPLLVDEKISSRTQATFDQLRAKTIAVAMAAKSPMAGNLLIRAFEKLESTRQARINHRWRNIEPVRWYILIGVAMLAQFAMVVAHLDAPGRPMMLSLFIITLLIVIVVGLIAMSVNPYEGIVVISPQPFQAALDSL